MNVKIKELVDFLKSDKNIKPVELKHLLEKLQFKAEDFKEWEDYNHPKDEGYGRKMVYSGEYFEVMIMSWMPNDFSSVHNHGYTQWGAVQVFGNASHYIYKLDKNKSISLARKESFKDGDIAMVNNALIHQMGNQTVNPYLSLHVYGTPTNMEDVTADSKIYEIEKNRIVETTGGAFFQLAEENVSKIADLQCTDEETINEFTATILPKSLHFNEDSKKSIRNWLKDNL